MTFSRRITLLAHGTRGDIEPFIALGLELKRRGHQVRLAVPETYLQFASEYGLDTVRLRCSLENILASGWLWKYARFGLLSHWLYIHDIQRGIGARVFEDAKIACERSEAIVFHPLMPFATDIAEAM